MRHPSVRGIGIRFVLGSTLPATGLALVLWTATQLFTALATGTVPPPPVVAQAGLERASLPAEQAAPPFGTETLFEQTPAEPSGRK